MMKLSRGAKAFYAILVLSVLMVNPPVLGVVNDFCVVVPLMWGYPSVWLWLEFWYLIMIIDFVVAAYTLKTWDCRQDDSPIEPVERVGTKEVQP